MLKADNTLEFNIMESNRNIQCTVSECKYHSKDDFCTLSHIKIDKNNNSTVSKSEYTKCASFEYKYQS
ncbi:DUF1540 domain-containing protein [Haloimpatiens sp. FM7330]|uniref:DUF1540 domain-containing protein n=1 Tax=Haloimpatiens sp. FM7330 TaxID=3298610 RepID=UPI00364325A3